MIFTNDHGPAHVHAFKANGEAIIDLGDENTKPRLRRRVGLKRQDLRAALGIAAANQQYLLEKWSDIHE